MVINSVDIMVMNEILLWQSNMASLEIPELDGTL